MGKGFIYRNAVPVTDVNPCLLVGVEAGVGGGRDFMK